MAKVQFVQLIAVPAVLIIIFFANVSCVLGLSVEYVPDNARFLGFDEVPLYPGTFLIFLLKAKFRIIFNRCKKASVSLDFH